MTGGEAITLKDVASDLRNARERLIAVETTLAHISRTLDQLSTDIRINTTTSIQSAAKVEQSRLDEEDSNTAFMRSMASDGRIRGWVLGAFMASVAVATFASNLILQFLGV